LSSVRIEVRQCGECLAGSYKKLETWNDYTFFYKSNFIRTVRLKLGKK